MSSGNGVLDFHCHVFVVCALASFRNAVRGTPGVVWRRLSLCHDVCDCLAHCMGAVKRYQFDALLSLALVLERTLATSASCGRSPPPGVCDHYHSSVGLVHFGFGVDWIKFPSIDALLSLAPVFGADVCN